MTFFRRLCGAIAGLSPTDAEHVRKAREYVDYVVSAKPARRAVSMTSDPMPGTAYRMHEGEILNLVENLQDIVADQGENHYFEEALSSLRSKVERQIEPDPSDWLSLQEVLNWVLSLSEFWGSPPRVSRER